MKTLTAILIVISPTMLLAQGPAASAQPTATVRPVSVLISATDRTGSPLANLTKDQLKVMDENAPAAIADLRPVAQAPLSVGIVLLASETNFGPQKAAAEALIQKLIRSQNDRVFVITAGGTKPWRKEHLDWESDRDALTKEVDALDKHTGLPDAFNYQLSTYSGSTAGSAAWWGQQGYQSANGPTVFDAVWGMMMADRRPARRVLLIFCNPWAHSSGLGLRSIEYADQMHAHIAEMAQKLHVAVYTIGVDEPSPISNEATSDIQKNYGMNGLGEISREQDRQIRLEKERLYNSGRANVERIAEQSGGQAFWSTKKNYRDAVNGIVEDLQGQYLLTFLPAVAKPGKHALIVRGEQNDRIGSPNAFELLEPAVAHGR